MARIIRSFQCPSVETRWPFAPIACQFIVTVRSGLGQLRHVRAAHLGIVRTVRTLLAFSHGSGMVQGFEWGFEGSKHFRTT